jgi:hypothetical protein
VVDHFSRLINIAALNGMNIGRNGHKPSLGDLLPWALRNGLDEARF